VISAPNLSSRLGITYYKAWLMKKKKLMLVTKVGRTQFGQLAEMETRLVRSRSREENTLHRAT